MISSNLCLIRPCSPGARAFKGGTNCGRRRRRRDPKGFSVFVEKNGQLPSWRMQKSCILGESKTGISAKIGSMVGPMSFLSSDLIPQLTSQGGLLISPHCLGWTPCFSSGKPSQNRQKLKRASLVLLQLVTTSLTTTLTLAPCLTWYQVDQVEGSEESTAHWHVCKWNWSLDSVGGVKCGTCGSRRHRTNACDSCDVDLSKLKCFKCRNPSWCGWNPMGFGCFWCRATCCPPVFFFPDPILLLVRPFVLTIKFAGKIW